MTPLPSLSGEEYRTLVEHGPVMVWRSSENGGCDYFNETWLRFTGRPIEDELGDGWTAGVHPDDLDACLRVYLDHFRRRASFEMEYRLRRHDGAYRWVVDRGTPNFDGARFRGFIGSCVDIHERHEAAETKEVFLRMMAHELRTPLQSIRMFVEVMRRQAGSGIPNTGETFRKLTGQLERLSRLVDDLAIASRAGDLAVASPVPVDLAALVRGVVEFRAHALEAEDGRRRHAIELVEGEGAPLPVAGDPARLQQVFANVLENAIKYSPDGGAIRVTLARDGSRAVVRIADSGIGIPGPEVASIGRRFFRGSNVSERNYPGLGLGFALAREIVERHGGTVGIESELGRGTTVSVSLPAASE